MASWVNGGWCDCWDASISHHDSWICFPENVRQCAEDVNLRSHLLATRWKQHDESYNGMVDYGRLVLDHDIGINLQRLCALDADQAQAVLYHGA